MPDLKWNVKAILIAILLPMSSKSSDRPRLTRKGEATRARIVDAAAALIFQQGVAGTTVEEVRDGAHVSSSQLYHYFEDKPALVRAVIERQADRAIGTQEQFDLSSLDGLREWRDFVVDHARDTDGRGGCPVGSLGSALAETEPEARASGGGVIQTLGGQHHGRFAADARAWPTRPGGRSAPARAGHACRASRAASCSLRSSATPNRSRPRSTRWSRTSPRSAAPRALRSTAEPTDRRQAVRGAHQHGLEVNQRRRPRGRVIEVLGGPVSR